MSESEAPTKYAQAMEAAEDDPDRTELTNMLYDLPHVCELLVDGEEDDWRPTTISVGFMDKPGSATAHVDTIMRRAGWKSDGTTFAPYNRRHYVPRDT